MRLHMLTYIPKNIPKHAYTLAHIQSCECPHAPKQAHIHAYASTHKHASTQALILTQPTYKDIYDVK